MIINIFYTSLFEKIMFNYPKIYTFLSRSVRGISCIESQRATRKYITFSTVITRTEIEDVTHDMTKVGLKRNRDSNGDYLMLHIFMEIIENILDPYSHIFYII